MTTYQRLFQILRSRKQGALTTTTVVAAVATLGLLVVAGASPASTAAVVAQGKEVFRFDSFGDEPHWTGKLRLHEVVRTTVDPTTALSVGLEVDAKNESTSLKSPETTVALLKLNAVVKGKVETIGAKDILPQLGVTCALCLSTVDNSFAPGIGERLDDWPNRDLNVGAIIAMSPALDEAAKTVYKSWGAPAAYGLAGINKITFTGDGEDVAYCNRHVGVTQMGGHGSFAVKRTGVRVSNGTDDLISSKLAALHAYQLSLPAPPPLTGSFDAVAFERLRTAKTTWFHATPRLGTRALRAAVRRPARPAPNSGLRSLLRGREGGEFLDCGSRTRMANL